jgi:hypothetical protein
MDRETARVLFRTASGRTKAVVLASFSETVTCALAATGIAVARASANPARGRRRRRREVGCVVFRCRPAGTRDHLVGGGKWGISSQAHVHGSLVHRLRRSRLGNVRRVVSTEIGLVVLFGACLLVAYVGLAVFLSGRSRFAGGLVLLFGVWSLLYLPVVHDRVHRERGEPSHALWGKGDRRKPPWWPAG